MSPAVSISLILPLGKNPKRYGVPKFGQKFELLIDEKEMQGVIVDLSNIGWPSYFVQAGRWFGGYKSIYVY